MSDAILDLNCWVVGDQNAFPVEIPKSKKVGDLKDAIKVKKHPAFQGIVADSLDLWKVSIPDTDAMLGSISTPDAVDGAVKLRATKRLSSYFLDTLTDGHIHIVMQRPPTADLHPGEKRSREEESVMSPFDLQDQQAKRYCKAPPPSTVCRSAGVMAAQQEAAEILNGRPWTSSGPPVGLYHPIFDRFTKNLDESAPGYKSASPVNNRDPRPTIGDVFSFMRACSEFYKVEPPTNDSRSSRTATVLPILERLLCQEHLHVVNSDWTQPDAVFVTFTSEGRKAPAGILEVKLEAGLGGDAKTQVQQSYARMCSLPEHETVRQSCCCPCFLIELSGPWITVLGAVFTKKVIVQHLAGPFYLSPQLLHPPGTFDAPVRLFYALRLAFQDLSEFYRQLGHSTKTSPFFPFVNSYPVSDGTQRNFRYHESLSSDDSKAVYEAIDADEKKIVVKFASTYNAYAHRLLAKHGLAPELIYDGTDGPRYGGLIMIIMSYVNGKTLNKLLHAQWSDPRISAVLTSVTKAIDLLHAAGLVFGDLRTPNIMVHDGGDVKLVDFDWCGLDGVDKYPFIIGDDIPWAKGVGSQETMHKCHDLHMLQQLEDKIQSGAALGTW